MGFDTREWLTEHRQTSTLLGICPMNAEIVRAAFAVAAERGFPPMFIATPRQVDADRGYTGWSQSELVEFLDTTATEEGYTGPYVVARDHGGPYQSSRDRGDDSVPLEDAMTYARELFTADLEAGLDVLHVDATEDPRIDGILALEEVAERTADLVGFIEETRKERGIDPVYYEVGTEEIEGGMTEPENFERFIELLSEKLDDVPGPVEQRVVFIVGQVGTTMRIDMTNTFDPEQARELVDIAHREEYELKVHYTDWLEDNTLATFPEIGIGAANVGPEFAAAIVESLAELEARERKLVDDSQERSNVMATLEDEAVEDAPWEKFVPETVSEDDFDAFAQANQRNIAVCVGRYALNNEPVREARETLYENIRANTDIQPDAFLVESVASAIERYVDAFDLTGSLAR
ncbi:class II D-tagatose-bisphosphate aldolase non-catalytic subunit [Halorhabdus amylolytica]|uniref:class II D-tagatose-bisphosphate aldolase non-catalytic subunit n=1 Tax=Halorhabdus amylolytica TaxID=2559573 RepID=UPI0010A9D6F1|nr:class II D-tagatose-bisphosphate aldolase, non-catalytic subunit [Halorhabdus amylolytica]